MTERTFRGNRIPKTGYEELRKKVRRLQDQGKLGLRLTTREKASWAWGNAKIENAAVTHKMAGAAAKRAIS